MDQRPIGVFDSGLGGLTAVREMRRLMPSENIIYFGDTSRVPYGGRSPEILLKYARQDVHFLRSFDIKAVLVACGTVSTTALPQLQAENDLPILGVGEPACRKAAAMTRNRRVGLIATAASVRSGAYERTLHRLDETIHVVSRACPLLVPLVENGRYQPGDVVIETVAREYLEPLRQEGLDVVILGATQIDTDFNVNVHTDSNGTIMGGSGGHSDTAAGAKLAMIIAPLTRARLSIVVDHVLTVSTPGDTIDVLVTQRGIAVNPRQQELKARLQAAGLPIVEIGELKRIAEQITGVPKPVQLGQRTVANVLYRDGTLLDTIKSVD